MSVPGVTHSCELPEEGNGESSPQLSNYLFLRPSGLGVICIVNFLMRDFIVNFSVFVTSFLTDILDRKGLWLMVSVVQGHCVEEVENRGSHYNTSRDRGTN